eukprot:GHVU01136667.1.p1 GENE.GHVU01136667.1~~GHVU01136667.1.p1  ORF type:complete len:270 (+),score=20.17 GHVU01136667.1:590-1399(+)
MANTKPTSWTGVVANSLATGLVFYGPFGANNTDIVSGNAGTAVNASNGDASSVSDADDVATTWNANTADDGGIGWATSSSLADLDDLDEYTMLLYCEIDSAATNANLMLIPYDDTAWTTPWIKLTLQKSGTSTSGNTAFIDASSNFIQDTVDSDTGWLDVDGTRNLYGIKRDGTVITYYKNGSVFGGLGSVLSTNQDVTPGDANRVFMFSRNDAASGEGATGTIFVGAIWNRALSDAEVSTFNDNPYQLAAVASVPGIQVIRNIPGVAV